MIGQTVSHYRITAKLGSGGMGDVYLAEDTRLGRKVALKFLLPELARDREAVVRFRNEAKAAAELSHPSIATIHDFDEADGRPFLVFEYLEGCTLKDRITEGPLPIDEVLRIGRDLAEGLAEAHTHGIVHRDIKSANIMLTPKGGVKILDFGLAHRADATQLTAPGTTLGTMAYMSPEQARGEVANERSDIWSLGVVLYECLTGRLPFLGERVSILNQIQDGQPPPPTGLRTGIPLALEQLILRCLEKDPGLRHQHADEIVASLNLLDREQSDATFSRPTLGASTSSTGGKRVALWAIVSILAIAGVAWIVAGDRIWPPSDRADQVAVPRLVVLPFESIGEPQVAYFEDGLVEEVTSALGTIQGLRVVGTESALSYRGSELTPAEIARDLEAEYFLTGSVRWSPAPQTPAEIRVSSRLIKTKDSSQVWASSSTRVADDIFLAQAAIASQVADALDLAMDTSDRNALATPPTRSPEAYELYLQGLEFERRMKGEARTAEGFFDEATRLDPGFGNAWAHLSKVRSWLVFAWGDVSMAEPALEAAQRARAELPDSFEADVADGYYHYWVRSDYTLAARHLEAATVRAPSSAWAHFGLAAVSRRQGQWEQALASYQRAHSLDPRHMEILWELAFTHSGMRQFVPAIALAERCLALVPQNPWILRLLILTHLRAGDPEKAAPAAREMIDHMGVEGVVSDLASAPILNVLAARLEELLVDIEDVSDDPVFKVTHLNKAIIYERLGDQTAARAHYEVLHATFDTLSIDLPQSVLGLRDIMLGYAAAKLGWNGQAIDAARRTETLTATMTNRLRAVVLNNDAATIYALAGEHDRALDLAEELLATPFGLSTGDLEVNPDWRSLRTHPRFRELLRRFKSG